MSRKTCEPFERRAFKTHLEMRQEIKEKVENIENAPQERQEWEDLDIALEGDGVLRTKRS